MERLSTPAGGTYRTGRQPAGRRALTAEAHCNSSRRVRHLLFFSSHGAWPTVTHHRRRGRPEPRLTPPLTQRVCTRRRCQKRRCWPSSVRKSRRRWPPLFTPCWQDLCTVHVACNGVIPSGLPSSIRRAPFHTHYLSPHPASTLPVANDPAHPGISGKGRNVVQPT